MDKLAGSLKRASGEMTSFGSKPKTILEEAAQDWARYSLGMFQGELLARALKISEALINFCHELDLNEIEEDAT